jgi:hypothetical protein
MTEPEKEKGVEKERVPVCTVHASDAARGFDAWIRED